VRVSSRALTLAISLLATAAIGVALPGCPLFFGDCGGWGDTMTIGLGVSVDLHAVAAPSGELDIDRVYRGLAVGAGGTIVTWGFADEPFVEVSSVGTADLRAILAEFNDWWVAGDGGTVAVSGDRGQTWTTVALPTTADLHVIARIGGQLLVAGDDVVLAQHADGSWIEVARPDGGWGRLRALYFFDGRFYAVGLAGVIWSTTDPRGEWAAEDSGTQADLFAIGGLYYKRRHTLPVAFGAGGTVLVRKSKGWDRVDSGQSVDLVDYDDRWVLGGNGELFEIDSRGKLSSIDTFAGAVALAESTYSAGLIAVGNGGAAFEKEIFYCEGRPFMVEGRPHTASLREGDGCDVWARDGLHEHASVASFARFALELLALGAPPRLLLDVQAAIHDEIRHARVCFELAERFGGGRMVLGPMPLPANAFSRVGDPVATALGLFDEACVNESVAACMAAEMAERSEDPEVRRVLESIAVDERRHAVAGWAALRWILDTFGDRVREPLRARLARLRPSNPVLAQLVVPLARAMLHPDMPAPREEMFR
jgi:hypothetical protein